MPLTKLNSILRMKKLKCLKSDFKIYAIAALILIADKTSSAQAWHVYDSLSTVYMKEQRYDSADVYAEKALRSLDLSRGEYDTLYADILNKLMVVNIYRGELHKSVAYCEKEKNIRKKVQGEKHPHYARTLNNLGSLYKNTGNFKAAESFFTEAKNIFRNSSGVNSFEYIKTLNNLASLYYDAGLYVSSEPFFIELKNIYKELIGEKDPIYIKSLNDLGSVYFEAGDYKSAENYFLEELKIRENVSGNKDVAYAVILNNIAVLYRTTGNYATSESYFLEAISIQKEVLGENHPDYARSLKDLALLYTEMGNYGDAEPLYLRAVKILEKNPGEKDPDYARLLNDFALFYKAMANYNAARPLMIRANNIIREALGENNITYATSLNNLATLYNEMGYDTAAEPLFRQSVRIRKEILGENHPDYAIVLINMGVFYRDRRENSEALPLFIQATKILKESLGEKNPRYATSLANLAVLYHIMHNYKAAEAAYLGVKAIREEVLGEKHPDYVEVLHNLAVLYNNMDNRGAAKSLFLEAIEKANNNIYQNFAFLSEKEKEMYFRTQATYYENFYAFSLKTKSEDKEITKTCYNTVLQNKGLLLRSSTAMRTAISNSNNSSMINRYKKWISLKKEISVLQSTELSKRKENAALLEQQANEIEKDLVKKSQVFCDYKNGQAFSWEYVKNRLKSGEAAIEFIHFTGDQDKMIYCALLIKPDSKAPEMINLFNEEDLEHILGTNRSNNISYINSIYGTNKEYNEQLYNLIWKPMETSLMNVKTIYYSPDGLLHKIAFPSIAKSTGLYLSDIYSLHCLSSTANVTLPESRHSDKSFSACIIGGIDYSTDSSDKAYWQYLPGTLTEANNIRMKLTEKKIIVNSFSGREASESTFKNIYSKAGSPPTIMHIATHGFFFPDPLKVAPGEKNDKKVETGLIAFRGNIQVAGFSRFVLNKNPLMRSGLVLSGANKVWSEPYTGTDNDGVLTAQEVSQLDMTNTNLVVLSACETGLGDIRGTEGVYGLQRAFKMAGVNYIIMSLWQVPDAESSEFMTRFYELLLQTMDINKSFNITQSEMRKKYDPYFWAAFVLIN
jgi:CHAT domain-containing protein